eukprot:TRINITY_DN807_c0_g1_i1.p1 TRINITY_DN807_c0_g1~~TRINITY_DN807_c0_g1_i1.p1  ORF type:complete len:744 (+),score=139.45 TRINITY_DN807_c0_g1_i1:99-2330(+)
MSADNDTSSNSVSEQLMGNLNNVLLDDQDDHRGLRSSGSISTGVKSGIKIVSPSPINLAREAVSRSNSAPPIQSAFGNPEHPTMEDYYEDEAYQGYAPEFGNNNMYPGYGNFRHPDPRMAAPMYGWQPFMYNGGPIPAGVPQNFPSHMVPESSYDHRNDARNMYSGQYNDERKWGSSPTFAGMRPSLVDQIQSDFPSSPSPPISFDRNDVPVRNGEGNYMSRRSRMHMPANPRMSEAVYQEDSLSRSMQMLSLDGRKDSRDLRNSAPSRSDVDNRYENQHSGYRSSSPYASSPEFSTRHPHQYPPDIGIGMPQPARRGYHVDKSTMDRPGMSDLFPSMNSPYTQVQEDSGRHNQRYHESHYDYSRSSNSHSHSYGQKRFYNGKSTPHRSALLENFRNSKNNKKYELTDIIGHFVEFSGDQHGSRFIQQKLENSSPEEKEMVFVEIYPQALNLMTDVFGNYVVQKFFEHGTERQVHALGETLVGNILELSLQMYGCRVVQKALEVISPEQQSQLVQELEGYVMKCIKDQNGNHVIQKVIEQVPPNYTQFIVDTFVNKVFQLATHPYGCRVIQRILEHQDEIGKKGPLSNPPPYQTQILKELLHCTISLVQDQYGNYVVQHVLKHGRKDEKHQIISQLRGKLLLFSQHKFASNVIEMCVEHGTHEHRQWFIDEICADPAALENMMKDQYANYVVQKILDTCDPHQRTVLIEKIRPHVASLKKYTYGKHIIARLEKIIGKINNPPN